MTWRDNDFRSDSSLQFVLILMMTVHPVCQWPGRVSRVSSVLGWQRPSVTFTNISKIRECHITMMSTQPPFLAPCLQSSTRSNDDPDLSLTLSNTQCCQKPAKRSPRSCVNLRSLGGIFLINSHSGVRGEHQVETAWTGLGWLLELTLLRRV